MARISTKKKFENFVENDVSAYVDTVKTIISKIKDYNINLRSQEELTFKFWVETTQYRMLSYLNIIQIIGNDIFGVEVKYAKDIQEILDKFEEVDVHLEGGKIKTSTDIDIDDIIEKIRNPIPQEQ